MKKILSLLIAIALILTLAIPAYAVTPELGPPDIPEIPDRRILCCRLQSPVERQAVAGGSSTYFPNWMGAAPCGESVGAGLRESHGAEDDPIPYEGNMVLASGLCYIQGEHLYRCTRDTVNPVYANPSDLVGL